MQIVNWTIPKNIEDKISILEYIEKDSNNIRESFYELVNNIGNYNLFNKPLFRHLNYKNIQSMWTMSLIQEKSHYKSNYIDNILKILAFKKYVERENPNKIYLEDSDQNSYKTLKKFCDERKIQLHRNYPNKNNRTKLYKLLPNFIQAFIWISKIYFEHSFLRNKKKETKNSEIFMCSYFAHLKNNEINKGNYSSDYWDGLSEMFISKNINVKWFHHYIKSKTTPSTKSAIKTLDSLNTNSLNNHSFITSCLNFKVFLKIVKGYISFRLQTLPIRISNQNFFFYDGINYKKFFKKDFNSSFFGIVAIENIMWVEIFNAKLKESPTQKLGIYLQENQPWEYAFINAWKNNGHKKLLAVQHSTVSFWDLRFLNSFNSELFVKARQSKPDFFSVNGDLAKVHFLNFEYKKDEIIELEALRYRNLENIVRHVEASKNILVLGDISSSNTSKLLDIIYPIVNNHCSWTFKPHPVNPHKINKDFKTHISLSNDPLDKIISKFDTIVCSDSSSVCIESLIFGLKTIIVKSSAKLNRSPLRGEESVSFVSSTEDILRAIKYSSINKSNKNYFYQSRDLYRWNRFITELDVA